MIHPDREYLKVVKQKLEMYAQEVLHLELNEKTQILPLKNGGDYLGFHFYLNEGGRVIRKVRRRTQIKYKKRVKRMYDDINCGRLTEEEAAQVLNSYKAHLNHGDTYMLQRSYLRRYL